jgi:hypothetical protein
MANTPSEAWYRCAGLLRGSDKFHFELAHLVFRRADFGLGLTLGSGKPKIEFIDQVFGVGKVPAMCRYAVVALCFIAVISCAVAAGNPDIAPVRVTSGTILTFHLQTRLHPNSENLPDVLPGGTILRVKILDRLDSGVDRDGAEFHGIIVSPIVSGNEVIVHSDAEVSGILALLRSKSHPDGFRYDLLITRINDHGKSYSLTASLNASFFEGTHQPASAVTAGAK